MGQRRTEPERKKPDLTFTPLSDEELDELAEITTADIRRADRLIRKYSTRRYRNLRVAGGDEEEFQVDNA